MTQICVTGFFLIGCNVIPLYTIFMVEFRSTPLIFSGIFLICLMLFATGCVGVFSREPEPTPVPVTGQSSQLPLQGQGLLACNQECADQAQCGTNTELGQVVLLSSQEPRLDAHDLLAGNNFLVDIREVLDVSVVRPGFEGSQPLRFYKVSIKDENIDRGDAWVAGWCIQAP